jgi:hypothetical protein
MNITAEDLGDRAIELLTVADSRGLCWQGGMRGLPDDPVAMIGYLAELLEVDLFLALDPGTEVGGAPPD